MTACTDCGHPMKEHVDRAIGLCAVPVRPQAGVTSRVVGSLEYSKRAQKVLLRPNVDLIADKEGNERAAKRAQDEIRRSIAKKAAKALTDEKAPTPVTPVAKEKQ